MLHRLYPLRLLSLLRLKFDLFVIVDTHRDTSLIFHIVIFSVTRLLVDLLFDHVLFFFDSLCHFGA